MLLWRDAITRNVVLQLFYHCHVKEIWRGGSGDGCVWGLSLVVALLVFFWE